MGSVFTAIFGFILKIINLIVMLIIRLVLLCFPALNLSQLNGIFTAFFGLLGGAINLTGFLLGDSYGFFATTIATIFTIKHIALPVVNIVRKFFLH